MMMIKDNHYVAIVADVAVAPEGLSRRGAARQLQYNGTNAEKAHLDQSYYICGQATWTGIVLFGFKFFYRPRRPMLNEL